MKYLLIFSAVFLMGCDESKYVLDRCEAAKLFKECLAATPKPPSHLVASGNDTDELVIECKVSARSLSIRLRKVVEPTCVGS